MTTHDPDALARSERSRLQGIAYRLTGSVTEAQDIVQEALLRLTRTDDVRDPAAWLTTVTTRLAIDHLRSARVRREQYVGPWLPEPLPGCEPELSDEPQAQAVLAESVTSALLVLLESLSPAERAAFVLHDVFGYQHDEVAAMLERSPAAVRQLASRARAHLAAGRDRFEVDARRREAVGRAFLEAAAGGDLDDLMALLSPDVRFVSDGGGVVTAARRPVVGPDRVARFVLGLRRRGEGMTMHPVLLNGGPGVLVRGPDGGLLSAMSVSVDVKGQVDRIFAVLNPAKLKHLEPFGSAEVWPLSPGVGCEEPQ